MKQFLKWPPSVITLRILQLLVSLVVLGGSAYSIAIIPTVGLIAISTSLVTLGLTTWLAVARPSLERTYERCIVLFFDVFLFLFWLVSFCLLNIQAAAYTSHDYDSVSSYDPSYKEDYKFIDGVILDTTSVLGGINTIFFFISLIIHSWVVVSNRNTYVVFLSGLASGIGLWAVLYFIQYYLVAVKDYAPDEADPAACLFFDPGFIVGICASYLFGIVRWPRMTRGPILLGILAEAIGAAVLAWAIDTERIATINGMLALVGFGTGLVGPPATILHIAGRFRRSVHYSFVIGLAVVAYPLGGLSAMTIMMFVFNRTSDLGSDALLSRFRGDLPEFDDEDKVKAKLGIVGAFAALARVLLLILFAACVLSIKFGEGDGRYEDEVKKVLARRAYFWALLRGKRPKDSLWAVLRGKTPGESTRMERGERGDEADVEDKPLLVNKQPVKS